MQTIHLKEELTLREVIQTQEVWTQTVVGTLILVAGTLIRRLLPAWLYQVSSD